MINILSYIGMNMHSEVCLWTILGLIRTIFDATLFRVNANLKQVWQMSMPEELSMPVQRVLRTMISGVMLVQCFTVYVYLASYIVLLYPVFLEERPTLVIPWLLLAAVRKLLCELTSLALGLGTCVLLGPARPPCIKFVIIKVISIMPAFYTWMLLFNYYNALKVAAAFKRFPAVLPPGDQDYGLELAIRRRRTKSLLGEEQLRSKLVASLYGERPINGAVATTRSKVGISSRMTHSTDTSSTEMIKADVEADGLRPNSLISNRISETGSYEDWFGSEVLLPRASDRILEQFVLMLLRIKAQMDQQGAQAISSQILNRNSTPPPLTVAKDDNLNCATIAADDADTPPQVGSSKENTALYLREYPQIFMKKTVDIPRSDNNFSTKTVQTRHESEKTGNTSRTRKRSVIVSPKEKISLDVEKIVSRNKYVPGDKNYKRRQSIPADANSSENTVKTSEDLNGSDIKLQDSCIVDNEKIDIDDTKPLLHESMNFIKENGNNIPQHSKMVKEKDRIGFQRQSRNKPSSSVNGTFQEEPSDCTSSELSDEAAENKKKDEK